MYPIAYRKEGTAYTFVYSKEDKTRWELRGKNYGDSGPVLHSIDTDTKMMTYKSYGTIDNPTKHKNTITFNHLEAWDGKWRDPDWWINDAKREHEKTMKEFVKDLKLVIIDFND